MDSVLIRPYCDLEDVQSVTGANDPEIDNTFIESINSASRMVDEVCGRDFWFHDHSTVNYMLNRRSVIGPIALLPFEIITLTDVGIDGAAIGIDNLFFDVGGRSIESATDFGGYPFAAKMELVGTFGFALQQVDGLPVLTAPPATLPSSVRRATALIAASLSGEWRKERVAPDGSRESLLEVRIPSEARALLRQWDLRKRLSTF
jgi:hypothetical protein